MRPIVRLAFAACLSVVALPIGPLVTPAQAQDAAGDRNYVLFFQEWSAQFDSSARALIEAVAKNAKAHPDAAITVTGYADPLGSARANSLVSALRAELVVDALVDSGIDAKRITQSAKGGTDYVMSAIESRRVTITVDVK